MADKTAGGSRKAFKGKIREYIKRIETMGLWHPDEELNTVKTLRTEAQIVCSLPATEGMILDIRAGREPALGEIVINDISRPGE